MSARFIESGRIFALWMLATIACSSSTESPDAPLMPAGQEAVLELDREVALGVGESAVLEPVGARILFEGVPDDSRCPIDVVCVWEGRATVLLTIEERDGPNRKATIVHGEPDSHIAIGDYRLRLVRLEPAARSDRPIPPQDYRVTLTLARAVAGPAG